MKRKSVLEDWNNRPLLFSSTILFLTKIKLILKQKYQYARTTVSHLWGNCQTQQMFTYVKRPEIRINNWIVQRTNRNAYYYWGRVMTVAVSNMNFRPISILYHWYVAVPALQMPTPFCATRLWHCRLYLSLQFKYFSPMRVRIFFNRLLPRNFERYI